MIHRFYKTLHNIKMYENNLLWRIINLIKKQMCHLIVNKAQTHSFNDRTRKSLFKRQRQNYSLSYSV